MNYFKSNGILASALIGLLLISPLALSADYNQDDYTKLLKEANKNGIVSVLIALENISLTEIRNSLDTVNNRTKKQAELLINELGRGAIKAGYWNNGIGQIGLYITAEGLQTLINTDLAISFSSDLTRTSRIRAEDEDGSLKEIESLLDKQGFANIEVFLNIGGIEYDISTTGGEDIYTIPSSQLTEVTTAANVAISSLITSSSYAQGIELISSTAMQLKNKPSFTAKIDREAYLGLRESENVRAIRPIGFIDKREAYWSAEAMELSAKNPEKNMDIIISLRGGELFSSRTGYMSTSAVTSQENAHARAINSVFTNAGLPPSFNSRYDKTGAYSVALKYSELKKLYAQKDNRILSLELNKIVATIPPELNNIIKYPEPVELCVQESISSPDLTQFTFDYTFVLPEEHLGQEGHIFVAFRLKSDPNKMHVWNNHTGADRWSLYDPNITVVNNDFIAAELVPIVTLNIVDSSMDVSRFKDDGQILVGYGFKIHEGDTPDDIFKEMLANERYSAVHTIGRTRPTDTYICTEVNKVSKKNLLLARPAI